MCVFFPYPSGEKVGDFDKFYGTAGKNVFYQKGPIGGVVNMGVDQTVQSSDSNSEVSADESVGTTRTNHSMSDENGNIQKITMPFIDFLGVGVSS